jgi:DNA-binding CsgD family transcriptional regulator/tetratricopeptide (TPR) repeat protein
MDRVSGLPDTADLSTPLPGREREQSALATLLHQALHGSGHLVLISGEAGIGKTTLSERLTSQARAEAMHVLTGHCYNQTASQPFSPWLDIRAALLDTVPQTINDPLSLTPDDAVSPGSKEELFERVVQGLRRILEDQPLVIILEDIHWADSASLELLRYVARQTAGLPLLLVASYREDDPDTTGLLPGLLPDLIRESRAHRLELLRLTLPDVQSFVNLSDRPASADDSTGKLAAYLYERSEGNPFFMTELARDLSREEGIQSGTEADLHTLPVPSLVRQVIENRAQRLSNETRTLLNIAAVIGQEVPVDLWQRVSNAGNEVLADAIDESISNYLLRESGDGHSVRFIHGLIQETLYHGQIALRRRGLRRQIAECLASQPNPSLDAVAHHFDRAGDERAVSWLIEAARSAQGIYASRDAVRSIDRAAQLADLLSCTVPVEAFRIRALARETLGEVEQARDDYRQALEIARATGDRRTECQTLIDLGLLSAGFDYQQSGTYLWQALEIAPELKGTALHARCLNRLGNWKANTGELDSAIGLHQQALAMFEASEDSEGIADTLDLLGSTTFLAGNYRTSLDYYDRAIALSRRLSDRRRLSSSLANLALVGGDFDVSFDAGLALTRPPEIWISYGEEAVEIAREIGWKTGESFALAMLGAIVAVRGELGRGLRLVEEAHEIAHRFDHQQWLTCTSLILGSLWEELLDPSRATFYLERGRAIAEGIGSQLWSILLDATLAAQQAEHGNIDAAFALLERWKDSQESPRSHAQRGRRFSTARLYLAAGKPELALEVAEDLLGLESSSSELHGVPQILKLKADALVIVGRLDEADAAYRDADHAARALGYQSIHWRILQDWSLLAQRQHHPRHAAELRVEAESIVLAIASAIDDPEIRNRFRQHALELVHQTSQHSPGKRERGGLSSRQIEVLSLVALGLTDAQVAERLYISPRTVARHLQTIYNQFGVNSRTAAVTLAYERKLIEPGESQ